MPLADIIPNRFFFPGNHGPYRVVDTIIRKQNLMKKKTKQLYLGLASIERIMVYIKVNNDMGL